MSYHLAGQADTDLVLCFSTSIIQNLNPYPVEICLSEIQALVGQVTYGLNLVVELWCHRQVYAPVVHKQAMLEEVPANSQQFPPVLINSGG